MILHRELLKVKSEFSDLVSGIYGKGMIASIVFKDPKTPCICGNIRQGTCDAVERHQTIKKFLQQLLGQEQIIKKQRRSI